MIRASRIILCVSLLFVLARLLNDLGDLLYNTWEIAATLWLGAAFFSSLQANRGYRLLAWMMGFNFFAALVVTSIAHLTAEWDILSMYGDNPIGELPLSVRNMVDEARTGVAEGIVGILVTLACAFPLVTLLRRELRAVILWDEEVKASEHREVESILSAPELKLTRSQPSAEKQND